MFSAPLCVDMQSVSGGSHLTYSSSHFDVVNDVCDCILFGLFGLFSLLFCKVVATFFTDLFYQLVKCGLACFQYHVIVGANTHYDVVPSREREDRVVPNEAYIVQYAAVLLFSSDVEYSFEVDYFTKQYWNIIRMRLSDGSSKSYIGLSISVFESDSEVGGVVDVMMPADVFFRFPIELVKRHLVDLAENDELDAVLLAEDISRMTGEYSLLDVFDTSICLKTFWISIIQRRWRNICAERRILLLRRGGLMAQRRFELQGKYGLPRVRGLKGMLSDLSDKSIWSGSVNTKTDSDRLESHLGY